MALYSLDRYPETEGDYRPGNVRWATWAQQRRNWRSPFARPRRAEA
jgi:hypothetical protein